MNRVGRANLPILLVHEIKEWEKSRLIARIFLKRGAPWGLNMGPQEGDHTYVHLTICLLIKLMYTWLVTSILNHK